jgi:molecular chaperone GrpE
MNPNNEIEDREDAVQEIDAQNSLSIDDFIKELEAKEKDLHISSDWAIEIEDSEFDDTNPPEFIKQEFAIEPVAAAAAKAPEPPVAPPPAVDSQALAALEKEILQMKQQVARMEAERFELAETMRRRQADFDGYKKRIERDRGESFLNQVGNLAYQMLPVLDNLDRALDFAARHADGKSRDFLQFFEGIVLVNQQLNEVLAEMGVSPIASVGEHFDPQFHEAVAVEANGELPANTVTGELLRGYRIGDKVVRAAMVKVSTAAKPAVKEPPTAAAPDSNQNLLETE